jgi:tetratricopeptide (TPR) repeat protein
MLRTPLLLLSLLALLLVTGSAQAQTSDELLLETRAELHAAYDRADAAGLDQTRARFDRMAGLGVHPALAHYYSALASLRAASFVAEDEREVYIDRSIASAQAALSLRPDFADAYALVASAYGRKVTGVVSGMRYGPKANEAMALAMRYGADNPRVLLYAAISSLYTPAIWGGGRDKAMPGFERAIALFDLIGEPVPTDLEPTWGRSEAHAWYGIGLRDGGDLKSARAQFERSLALNPNSGWVRYTLLPSAEASAGN